MVGAGGACAYVFETGEMPGTALAVATPFPSAGVPFRMEVNTTPTVLLEAPKLTQLVVPTVLMV